MVFERLCVYLVLSTLAPLVVPVAVPDIWPDVDWFLSKSVFQPPAIGLGGPFQSWNLIDIQNSFDLKLMNSSWSGPAETNVYHKGDLVHLQVSSLSAPDHELFIQSCYATSSNPLDKSRAALILNRGCVSSKQSAVEFISRKPNSIDLLLNTSQLPFTQVFVHCSVAVSSTVTPGSKSCNYKKNSVWVELSGQTSVCECCASKCTGPPSYGEPSNELNAIVSTGPFTIKEEQHKDSPNSSRAESSVDQSGSRKFPSSMEKGWIVASATLSDGFKMNVPYSSSWLSQSVGSDGIMVLNKDSGNALSAWLPGLMLEVTHNPVLELDIDLPQQKNASRLVGWSRLSSTSSEGGHVKTPSVENVSSHDWEAKLPERVSDVYMGDSPGWMNDWDLEGFPLPEEELRGDVFMNYKWPQQHLHKKVQDDSLASPLLGKPEEPGQEIKVLKQNEKEFKKDELGTLEYMKKTMLTFRRASDGSSSLSYEEEERSPSVEVKKSKLEIEQRKVDEQAGSKEVEKDLMQSLLAVVRDLQKTTGR